MSRRVGPSYVRCFLGCWRTTHKNHKEIDIEEKTHAKEREKRSDFLDVGLFGSEEREKRGLFLDVGPSYIFSFLKCWRNTREKQKKFNIEEKTPAKKREKRSLFLDVGLLRSKERETRGLFLEFGLFLFLMCSSLSAFVVCLPRQHECMSLLISRV